MTDQRKTTETTSTQPELRRVMGPKLLLFFIVGDILGTGVYALTGAVAGEVGGAVWVPFLIASIVAMITAFSYLELVTRYPQAAGAALYVHKAFGVHILTFLVAFAVMCSGITSASTAANAFAGFVNDAFNFGLQPGGNGILLVALGFMALVAVVNHRGVSESVKANIVLTTVELSGLLLVILVCAWAIFGDNADLGRVVLFETSTDKNVFLAITAGASLAFFAMVGFEDSVNMAEECKDPVRDFPRTMLTGITVTGVIYVLVAVGAVAVVPVGELTNPANGSALVQVMAKGAPGMPFADIFPFIAMFAVANSALINMMMASRLLYGLSRQGVLPRWLGSVHRDRQTPGTAILGTTLISFALITFVVKFFDADAIALLGGTTALLLLCVFALVHVALIIIRRRPYDGKTFRAPRIMPYVGAVTCVSLAGPWARSDSQQQQYLVAGGLLLAGLILWLITKIMTRATTLKTTSNEAAGTKE
ncbi:APC family permease [Rhodococcus sp. IEGM1428]|uniref:APC family permease n=1 Tax=Rhodococcus sp. IEGM1428 TaxID=3392191 RepID=UPI003D123EBD